MSIYLSSFWLYFCWDNVAAHSSAMMGGGVDGICGSDLLFIQLWRWLCHASDVEALTSF